MSLLISKRTVWRLIWLLGIAPLLVTDIAVAVALSQVASSSQVDQADSSCLQIRSILESLDNEESGESSLNPVVETIGRCPEEELADVLTGVRAVLETSSHGGSRVAALYGLIRLSERFPTSSVIDERLPDLLRQTNSLLLDEASQVQTAAARTVGVLAIRAINNQLDIDLTETVDSGLLPLSVSEATVSSTEVNVKLAALNALRDIGYAIQERVRQESRQRQFGQETQSDVDEGGRQNLDRYEMLADQVIEQLVYQFYASAVAERTDNSISEELLVDLGVARVEALSAVLLIRTIATDNADNTALDSRDKIGIWVLNYLAANAAEAGLVQATAIASLERLGYRAPFSQLVEQQLQAIAADTEINDQLLNIFIPGRGEGADYRASSDLLLALSTVIEASENAGESNDSTASTETDTAGQAQSRLGNRREERRRQQQAQRQQSIRISAVEMMSRVSFLRAQQNAQPTSPAPQAVPANSASPANSINPRPHTSASVNSRQPQELFYLLGRGLDSENNSEIRQRAEIAFSQIYNRNLGQLSEAVANAGGSGNRDVQRTAVRALGGVNYRRIPPQGGADEPPEHLRILTRFLGQSLMCSGNEEVREEAAYALGQIAPYWPQLLHEPLAPYWPNLISVGSSEPYEEICRNDSRQEHQQPVNALDALLLRLDDPSSEQVIVFASYALSRYGIALDSKQKSDDFQASLPLSREVEQNDESLQVLRTCMKALVYPSGLERWVRRDLNLALYQPLRDLAQGYAEDCRRTYSTFRSGSDRSAIAAAYILGQVGFSDGHETASLEEQETVEYLLRVLNGRDLLTEIEFNELEARGNRRSLNNIEPTPDSPYRVDSVRDSIVSYALGQIHPREHELVELLVDAVKFPDWEYPTEQPSNYYIERETSCNYDRSDYSNPENAPICLNNPTTRTAVLGALESIGIEDRSVRTYVEQLRRLLTQDINSSIVQAAIPSVVEQIAAITTSPEGAASRNGVTQADLAEAEYVLSVPYHSIFSCIGATYALARTGVSNSLAVDQLMNYLYVYPQALPEPTDRRQEFGNLCTTVAETDSHESNQSASIPSRLEQLILLKSGAITALGQIDEAYQNDIPAVVRCLVRIANFGPLVPNPQSGCPIREPVRPADANLSADGTEPLTEISQAEKWELFTADSPPEPDASQYYLLKFELREPAIEAIGQLARTETDDNALCALAFDDSVAECRDINSGRIEYNLDSGFFFQPRDESGEPLPIPIRRQTRSLMLRQLEAAALHFQASYYTSRDSEERDRLQRKLHLVRKLLLPVLTGNAEDAAQYEQSLREASQNEQSLRNAIQRRQDEQDFRDAVLSVLVGLDPVAFSDPRNSASDPIYFTIDERKELIQQLFGESSDFRQPTGIAGECLSETDLLRQEFVCFGVTRLLSSIWLDSFNPREQPFTSVVDFMQELAQSPSESRDAQYSLIIRASAVEVMGRIGLYDAESQSILFSNLELIESEADQPRVVEQDARIVEYAVSAFAQYEPDQVIPSLRQRLQGNDDEALQAAYLIRQLGRMANAFEANPEELEGSVHSSWVEALGNSDLSFDLVRILENSRSDDLDLQLQTIYALGELRNGDRPTLEILEQTLNQSNNNSTRAAAAYALGKIGEAHPEIATSTLPLLYDIVVNENDVSDELRVAAAYAIAEIGIPDNLPASINRYAIVNSLIAVYNNAIHASSDSEMNPDAEAVGAIALYAMSELEVEDPNIAEIFASSLQPNRPVSIRVIAAAYAQNLPRWNQNLIDNLIDAVKDSNIALRYSAVLSLGQNPNHLGETHRENITTELDRVFWNEREYSFIRLAAGEAICNLWQIEHFNSTESCQSSALLPQFPLAFSDMLTALQEEDFYTEYLLESDRYGIRRVLLALREYTSRRERQQNERDR
jgi:hypothetical protein